MTTGKEGPTSRGGKGKGKGEGGREGARGRGRGELAACSPATAALPGVGMHLVRFAGGWQEHVCMHTADLCCATVKSLSEGEAYGQTRAGGAQKLHTHQHTHLHTQCARVKALTEF